MPRPSGFLYEQHGDASVTITHRGRPADTLRGGRAEKFLAEVESGDAQLVMARWTGRTSTATSAPPATIRATADRPRRSRPAGPEK